MRYLLQKLQATDNYTINQVNSATRLAILWRDLKIQETGDFCRFLILN